MTHFKADGAAHCAFLLKADALPLKADALPLKADALPLIRDDVVSERTFL
jgi:hypothetical protein